MSCYLLIITTFTLDAAQKSEVTGKNSGICSWSEGLVRQAEDSQNAKNCQIGNRSAVALIGCLGSLDLCMRPFLAILGITAILAISFRFLPLPGYSAATGCHADPGEVL